MFMGGREAWYSRDYRLSGMRTASGTSIRCIQDGPGNMGDRAGNFAIQNSDLVLSVGSRPSIRVGYNYKTWARAFVIANDIDSELKEAFGACRSGGSCRCEGSAGAAGRSVG